MTQSLSGKKRVSVKKYAGKRGEFHIMEESWRNPMVPPNLSEMSSTTP
ncbi:MAG: hypothetical protein ACR2PF_01470 [Rhizobiaceae bacterium]